MADPTEEQQEHIRCLIAERISKMIVQQRDMLAASNGFDGGLFGRAVVSGAIDGVALYCSAAVSETADLSKMARNIAERLELQFTHYTSTIPPAEGSA